MLTAEEVTRSLTLTRPLAREQNDLLFTRIVVDSRDAGPGDLFVALRGERTDGHRFIQDAIQRGVTGVLAREAPLDIESRTAIFLVEDPLAALQRLAEARRAEVGPRTVGITGSVGKTSTKEAVAGLLQQFRPVLKSTGNLNTEIGLPLVLLDLQPDHHYLVVEMGMNALGEIAELCRIARPSIGVVTNVGPVHLERLGTIERIADAKAELPENLPEDGIAILNADDPRVAAMAPRTRARVVTYGLSPGAHCRATHIEVHGLSGISFRLHWSPPGPSADPTEADVRVPLIGRHSVYTCLAAAAVALTEGHPLSKVAQALAQLESESRIKVRRASTGATILDDCYNASPASVKAALDVLSGAPSPRVAVLGDMLELGTEEVPGHQDVGRYAACRVDHLITIGPRMAAAAEAAVAAGMSFVSHFPDKQEALPGIRTLTADPQTTVLVKASRGVALETIVDDLCGGS